MSGQSVLMVAGEASADLHGARVVAALTRARPGIEVFGIGGSAMRAEGMTAVAQAEEIAVAGLTEVLLAVPRIFGILRRLVAVARERRPSAAVLIDLPDFNLRLARRLKKLGIPVVYYISPQVWAWRAGRVSRDPRGRRRDARGPPVRAELLRRARGRARFVGHPLVEQLPEENDASSSARRPSSSPSVRPIVALLPGSRRKEVTRHLPAMLGALQRLRLRIPELQAVLPVASTIPRPLIEELVRRSGVPVRVLDGRSTEALIAADAAVVCSGHRDPADRAAQAADGRRLPRLVADLPNPQAAGEGGPHRARQPHRRPDPGPRAHPRTPSPRQASRTELFRLLSDGAGCARASPRSWRSSDSSSAAQGTAERVADAILEHVPPADGDARRAVS